MKTVSELISEVSDLRNNPADIQRVVLSALESTVAGEYDVVDPSNPFVFLLEASCVSSAAAMSRMEAVLRKQYPTLAQSEEDLYNHMSDEDYLNRFAVPGRTTLTFMISLGEVLERAISDENGIQKLVIPRDTEITVEGMTFTLQYPIEIRVLSHGGQQVVYDVSTLNPLLTLESNIIDWSIVKMPPLNGGMSNIDLIMFKIPVTQFKITSYYDQLNPSSGFVKRYPFNDQFYYGRVWQRTVDGTWVEIHTTHSEQVYDSTKPTALFKVIDNELQVEIPQIYFTSGLLSSDVRIDIYTTKGNLTVSLDNYTPDSYVAVWKDLTGKNNQYVDLIRSFSTIYIFSDEKVNGGRDKLSFENLRERVIQNALGELNIPITPAQLASKMENMGYNVVKDVDNITNRTYMASKSLPKPNSEVLSSSVGCTINTLQSNLETLINLRNVKDNVHRVTIESGMLFQLENGILNTVENATYDALVGSTPEGKAQLLSTANYVYTPFHYVLDSTGNRFDCRAYYLDKPVVLTKEFVAENRTARLEVATLRYAISKTTDGYKLVVITRSGDVYKSLDDSQLHAQLSFIPDGEIDRAYLNGTLVGRTDINECIFEFDLNCTFDVDSKDKLQLTSFKMYDLEHHISGIDLVSKIELMYIVSDYNVSGMESSALDTQKGNFLLPANARAVIKESLNVSFGKSLKGLWSRGKTVVGSQKYLTYDHDVPATYTSRVYLRDEVTGLIDITRDPETGDIGYTVLHEAGDPVLDGDGLPVYAFRKGDVKLDNDGNPIVANDRTLDRQMDLLLLEGSFAFVKETEVISYLNETISQVVNWVSDDIPSIQKRLLENTDLWYYPEVTLGDVSVTVEDGVSTATPSDQSFRVKYYLTKNKHDNIALREELTAAAVNVISDGLSNSVVSVREMAGHIKAKVQDDVIDVVVSGLGGGANYEMLSIKDPSTRLNIRKKPVVLPNNVLTVKDDVSVEFLLHKSN